MRSAGIQFGTNCCTLLLIGFSFLPYPLKQLTRAHPDEERELLQRGAASSLFSGVGKGPTGVIKSILDTSRTDGKVREEIFVDIVEKISCTFSSSGSVQNSQIDGAIQVQAPSYFYFNTYVAASPCSYRSKLTMKTRGSKRAPFSATPISVMICSHDVCQDTLIGGVPLCGR